MKIRRMVLIGCLMTLLLLPAWAFGEEMSAQDLCDQISQAIGSMVVTLTGDVTFTGKESICSTIGAVTIDGAGHTINEPLFTGGIFEIKNATVNTLMIGGKEMAEGAVAHVILRDSVTVQQANKSFAVGITNAVNGTITLVNEGTITGDNALRLFSVGAGNVVMQNTGAVTATGAGVTITASGSGALTLDNSGTITSDIYGVTARGMGQDTLTIVNNGAITGAQCGLHFNDMAQVPVTVYGSGTASGAYGAQLESGTFNLSQHLIGQESGTALSLRYVNDQTQRKLTLSGVLSGGTAMRFQMEGYDKLVKLTGLQLNDVTIDAQNDLDIVAVLSKGYSAKGLAQQAKTAAGSYIRYRRHANGEPGYPVRYAFYIPASDEDDRLIYDLTTGDYARTCVSGVLTNKAVSQADESIAAALPYVPQDKLYHDLAEALTNAPMNLRILVNEDTVLATDGLPVGNASGRQRDFVIDGNGHALSDVRLGQGEGIQGHTYTFENFSAMDGVNIAQGVNVNLTDCGTVSRLQFAGKEKNKLEVSGSTTLLDAILQSGIVRISCAVKASDTSWALRLGGQVTGDYDPIVVTLLEDCVVSDPVQIGSEAADVEQTAMKLVNQGQLNATVKVLPEIKDCTYTVDNRGTFTGEVIKDGTYTKRVKVNKKK